MERTLTLDADDFEDHISVLAAVQEFDNPLGVITVSCIGRFTQRLDGTQLKHEQIRVLSPIERSSKAHFTVDFFSLGT